MITKIEGTIEIDRDGETIPYTCTATYHNDTDTWELEANHWHSLSPTDEYEEEAIYEFRRQIEDFAL